jgi:hypothetical protein
MSPQRRTPGLQVSPRLSRGRGFFLDYALRKSVDWKTGSSAAWKLSRELPQGRTTTLPIRPDAPSRKSASVRNSALRLPCAASRNSDQARMRLPASTGLADSRLRAFVAPSDKPVWRHLNLWGTGGDGSSTEPGPRRVRNRVVPVPRRDLPCLVPSSRVHYVKRAIRSSFGTPCGRLR